jgi:23S rRNA pseudouridine2605 synthase
VRVNGKVAPTQGMLVDAARDRVTVRGKAVAVPARHRYLVFNKPKGVLVTARDTSNRPTVFDVLGADALQGHRLFPIGRLDMDTSGLLLLTDDGELANALAHPRRGVEKEYQALVRGVPSKGDLRRLRDGVDLDDGLTAPARAELVGTGPTGASEVRLIIHEGRNRQVRRMLEAVGHPVRELRRVGFGPLRLGRLREGGYRALKPGEVQALRDAVR